MQWHPVLLGDPRRDVAPSSKTEGPRFESVHSCQPQNAIVAAPYRLSLTNDMLVISTVTHASGVL